MMNLLLPLTFAALITQSALAGTWTAQRDYGPVFSGGPIVVTHHGRWNIRVAGVTRSAPTGNVAEVAFDDGSELRLRESDARLAGQWIQPGDADDDHSIATPIIFAPAGTGSWRGIVRPIPNVQHVAMVVTESDAGGLQAYFLNPEENAGLSIGERELSLHDDTVLFHRSGADDVVGRFDPHFDALIVKDPGLNGTYAFKRAAASSRRPYSYHQPIAGLDGWKTARLRDVGFDEPKMTSLVNSLTTAAQGLRSPQIQALLVARHGRLVMDDYFDGFNGDRPHDVRSAGKSVATLLIGKAIESGAHFTPATTVSSILSNYTPFAHDSASKARITVADLMAMSAGYACDDNDDSSPGNEDRMQSQTATPDWYKFTLDLPMSSSPGTRATYCSAEINLLGAVIERTTDVWLPDFFHDSFARPMQFGDYGLWLSPPPTYTAYMAGGDTFRPRDFLKFGELFLDGGRWHGTQIVDPRWLSEIAKKHSFVEGGGGDYGWGWHLSTYHIGGHDIQAISAGGNGGQLLYIFPQLDLTIMITAGNFSDYRVWSRFQDIPAGIIAALTTSSHG